MLSRSVQLPYMSVCIYLELSICLHVDVPVYVRVSLSVEIARLGMRVTGHSFLL